MLLKASVDPSDLARIRKKLDALSNAVGKRSVSRALSRGLSKLQTEAYRAVKGELPILTRERIVRAFKTARTSSGELYVAFDVSQQGVPLINFVVGGARTEVRAARKAEHGTTFLRARVRSPSKGVYVQVKEGRKKVFLGFIQRPAKGGIGVFKRSGALQGRKRGSGGDVYPRYPIEFLFGPSVYSVFKPHAEEVGETGRQVTLAELERQIDLALLNSSG